MKKKKNIFLTGVFIILLGLLIYLVNYNIYIDKLKSTSQYVLINDLHYWKYDKSGWSKLDAVVNPESVSDEISWKKYNIFIKNKYYNTFKFSYMNSKEYFFDDSDNSYDIPDNKILLNKGSYLKLINYKKDDLIDKDIKIIDNVLKDYNYSFDDLVVQIKYNISDNESIYILSNYDGKYSDYEKSDIFNLIFYRINNKNYILLSGSEDVGFSNYNVAWLVDTKDKFINIILSYTCYEDVCYDLYHYGEEKFNKVID